VLHDALPQAGELRYGVSVAEVHVLEGTPPTRR
jgi:hypothetical protein